MSETLSRHLCQYRSPNPPALRFAGWSALTDSVVILTALGSLKFACVSFSARLSGKREVDRNPRMLRRSGSTPAKRHFEHFDRESSRQSNMTFLYTLRTAIPALRHQAADGISYTSNSPVLFEGNAIILVNRCEKGGSIVPVTNKGQFDGIEQCICTHK